MSSRTDGARASYENQKTDRKEKLFSKSMEPYQLQTGGHFVGQENHKPGILLHQDNSILKPIVASSHDARERQFYQRIFSSDCHDPVAISLQTFIPRFLGVFEICGTGKTDSYLKLENLTSKFKRPSVMDVKIGFRTYDPEASPDKIKRSLDKYITTKTLGFCIPGMKVYDSELGRYIVYDKKYGKSITENNIKDALICFFGGKNIIKGRIIHNFLNQLTLIKKWFSGQQQFAFYSSSLLFIYETAVHPDGHDLSIKCCTTEPIEKSNHWDVTESESSSPRNGFCTVPKTFSYNDSNCQDANFLMSSNSKSDTRLQCKIEKDSKLNVARSFEAPSRYTDDGSGEAWCGKACEQHPLTDIRMIDFAHVFDIQETDSNYLGGLNNLIKILEEIARDYT